MPKDAQKKQLFFRFRTEEQLHEEFFEDYYLQWMHEDAPDILVNHVGYLERMRSGRKKAMRIYSMLGATLSDTQLKLLDMLVDELDRVS